MVLVMQLVIGLSLVVHCPEIYMRPCILAEVLDASNHDISVLPRGINSFLTFCHFARCKCHFFHDQCVASITLGRDREGRRCAEGRREIYRKLWESLNFWVYLPFFFAPTWRQIICPSLHFIPILTKFWDTCHLPLLKPGIPGF